MKWPLTLTPENKALLQSKHRDTPHYGNDGTRLLGLATAFLENTASRTALDLSCGKGKLLEALNAKGFEVAGYDPGVERFDVEPTGVYDVVMANMCLYEYPLSVLPQVLEWMRAHSTRGVFISYQFGGPAFGMNNEPNHITSFSYVYDLFRHIWPSYDIMDSGVHDRIQRKLVFQGYAKGFRRLL